MLAQAELMASNEQSIQQRQQRQQGGSNTQQGTSRSQAPQISAADLANALSFATVAQGIKFMIEFYFLIFSFKMVCYDMK